MLVASPPTPMPCAVPVPAAITVTWPSSKVFMSKDSVNNFERFNDQGYGRMWVIVDYDGTVRPLVPRTRDIDAGLGATLATYSKRITVSPTVRCGNAAAVFLMQFDVPSGAIHYIVVPDAAKKRPEVPTPPPPP